jgi:hypothetical protein
MKKKDERMEGIESKVRKHREKLRMIMVYRGG